MLTSLHQWWRKTFTAPAWHSHRPPRRVYRVEVLEDRFAPAGLPAHAYGQWANSVVDVSSQYNSSGTFSAVQALNAPDTKSYGDLGTAWAPSSSSGTKESITVAFATPTIATGVIVRETYGNGFVYRIDLIDTSNVAHTVWTGRDLSPSGSPVNFTVTFPATSYEVKAVKIFVDTDITQLNTWEEIDAVRLLGPAAFTKAADLAVISGSVASADRVPVGGKATVKWAVKNVGAASAVPISAGGTSWKDLVYVSWDSQLDASDVLVGSRSLSISALAAGKAYSTSLAVSMPSDYATWAGKSAYLLIRSDVNESVLEANFENGIRAIPITFSPYVSLQSPGPGRFVDPTTVVQFQTLAYDWQGASVVDIAVDTDANPRNGGSTWVSTNRPVTNLAVGDSVTATLSALPVRKAPYYVWARLRESDTGQVVYSQSIPITVASRAALSDDALNDVYGGTSEGYEVYGLDAARFGRTLHVRVRTNYRPDQVGGGGDLRLVIGGQLYGLAVNTHSIAGGGMVYAGQLYAGATFLNGTSVATVPTFIDTFTSRIAKQSTVRVLKTPTAPWAYQIEATLNLAAVPSYQPGDSVQVSWAMYCGNDTDDVTIQPEASDIELRSAKISPNDMVEFEYLTRGEMGSFNVGLYLSRDKKFDPTVDQRVTSMSLKSTNGAVRKGIFLLDTTLNHSAPYLLVVADPWSGGADSGGVVEYTEQANNWKVLSIPSITARFEGGRLTIAGTDVNDVIKVFIRDDLTTISVLSGGDGKSTTATIPIQVAVQFRDFLSAAAVKKIRILGKDGDDKLTNSTEIPAYMDGGEGKDELTGGLASDALFGGTVAKTTPGIDILNGGGSVDRLYWHMGYYAPPEHNPRRAGVSPEDAVVYLSDTATPDSLPPLTLQGASPPAISYTPASWTPEQVEMLDSVFEKVQARTNNATLLQTHLGEVVTFRRVAAFFKVPTGTPDDHSAFSRFGVTYLPNETMGIASHFTHTVVHELGHLRDSESGGNAWAPFLDAFGWSLPDPNGLYVLDPAFKRADYFFEWGYDDTSPYEDFVDSFAAAILNSKPTGVKGAKWQLLSSYLNTLRTP